MEENINDEIDYEDLGYRIKSARVHMGITQEDLALMVDISPSFLGHIERGTRIASLETFVQICNVLDTTPEFLLAGSLKDDWPSPYNAESFQDSMDGDSKLSEFLRIAEETVRNWNN